MFSLCNVLLLLEFHVVKISSSKRKIMEALVLQFVIFIFSLASLLHYAVEGRYMIILMSKQKLSLSH